MAGLLDRWLAGSLVTSAATTNALSDWKAHSEAHTIPQCLTLADETAHTCTLFITNASAHPVPRWALPASVHP